VLSFLLVCPFGYADGERDNQAANVRSIPPDGIQVPKSDRTMLFNELKKLEKEISDLRQGAVSDLLIPDVEIFSKAVRYALEYDEFYKPKEIQSAAKLLEQGRNRAASIKEGKAPWTQRTGLVVRGYRSRIDGSAQPYGLVVPDTWYPDSPYQHRLDFWFHGRGEKLTELSFIDQRQSNHGQFTPKDGFVLHLYGRYCNANKFAGEIDLFEAWEHAKQFYSIDENRVSVRGFSMGGAACWQFAVHYPGLWAAAAPGAGFSETPDFLRTFQNETLNPTWYEKKLWHWYDCTDYAINLFNCPTVAYSGGADRQKQAADIMAKALSKEGIHLTHLIGPDTGHKYHPQTKQQLIQRIDSIVDKGRNPVPTKIKFTTWTLRYNRMQWLTIDGLDEHWTRARMDAEITDASTVRLKTTNVSGFSLKMNPGCCPLDNTLAPIVIVDGTPLKAVKPKSDRSWSASFHKVDGEWKTGKRDEVTLRKHQGLQGPIDDAFMDSFIMVMPTGKAFHEPIENWTQLESEHALQHWRSQFRGDARTVKDVDLTPEQIAAHHLILWGDPKSNSVLKSMISMLPIQWREAQLGLGEKKFDSKHHVPILIYPNPLNPEKYVVLNSGFTFREYDYLNNARQVAKLPDFAVVDIHEPVTSQLPGKIVEAGFFNEEWQLKPSQE